MSDEISRKALTRQDNLKRRDNWMTQVFDMVVQGYTSQEIAKALNIKKRMVWNLAKRACDEHAKRLQNAASSHAMIDLARIEGMIKAISEKAYSGDKYAIETALKLLDRKAKLLGLDKPTKVDVSVQVSLAGLVSGSMAIDQGAIEVPSTVVSDGYATERSSDTTSDASSINQSSVTDQSSQQ